MSKPNKYSARRTHRFGRSFASAGEAERFAQLQLLERAGAIHDLRTQVPFVLAPAVRDPDTGRTLPPIRLVVDFTYREDGALIAEDFKGVETPVWRLKRHLFLLQHPDVVLRITRRG